MNEETDDQYFLLVARELSAKMHDEALWTKAFALENGDADKTRAHYIRLRVEQLRRKSEAKAAPPKISARESEHLATSTQVHSEIQFKQPVDLEPRSAGLEIENVSPWPRLWARNIDFLPCMLFFVMLSLSLPLPANIFFSALIAFTVSGVVIIAYDTVLISLFGTTFGKALFGIKVIQKNEETLPWDASFRRACGVWAKGNGCYLFFPAVTLFSWWDARKVVKETGESPWDMSCDSMVIQSQIGSMRYVFFAFVGVCCFVVSLAVAYAVKKENKAAINSWAGSTQSAPVERAPRRLTALENAMSGESAAGNSFDKPDRELLPFERRAWSGNIFDKFDSVEAIERKARKRDARMTEPRVWAAVIAWQQASIRHWRWEPNVALYFAVDEVLEGLKDGGRLCRPGPPFVIDSALATNSLPVGSVILVSACDPS